MKKIILSMVFFVLLACTALAEPFICTSPSPRVEWFTVFINDKLTGLEFDPEPDDTLVLDIVKDLNIKTQFAKVKIVIVASNSDGHSKTTSFYLMIYKTANSTVYRIDPIPEDDNTLYMTKFDEKNLEVAIVKQTGGGKKGGGFSFFGLF
jgi:hypothetical protein